MRRLEIVIITQGPELYSTTRLASAARARGHGGSHLNPTRCTIRMGSEDRGVLYNGQRIVQPMDCLIPRIGASITQHGLRVLRQFEAEGVLLLNSTQGIAGSRDKLRAMQAFDAAGLDIPKTAYARGAEDLRRALGDVGGPPVILKLLEGTQGIGVMRCDTLASAESVVDVLSRLQQPIIVQEYVREARGQDLRIIVVGDRAVAAMRRKSGGDFRSNIHRGGTGTAVTLDAETERIAIEATRCLGLRVAGVDLLESDRGPLLLEVNSSPGLEGIEGATNIDVANEIISEVERICD